MASSSSDSDGGEKIKNIHSVIIKSESSHQEGDKKYAYKRKLGDLIFNANFEGGNLGHVERINQYEYDLMVRPDVANTRSRLWFNFTISNQLPNQCVIFTFVNLSEKVALFHEGLTPVVRSKIEPNWVRLHEDQVFYYRSANHGKSLVLSIAFRFSTYENEHQFATFYPYTYTNLVNFITRWSVQLKRSHERSNHLYSDQPKIKLARTTSVRRQYPAHYDASTSITRTSTRFEQVGEDVSLEATSLGSTILSKEVYKLLVRGTSSQGKPKVVVLCRPSGNIDSVSSVVCLGLLDYILCDDPISRVAREFIDFICYPMIDPDSIYVGNGQTDMMGQSFVSARSMMTNKFVHANLLKINDTIEHLCAQGERLILLEFKVNLGLIGSRIVGTRYKDSLRMERHLSLVRQMARFANDFYLENSLFCSQSDSLSSPFDFRSRINVDQYRLEISPFAYYHRSLTDCKLEEYSQMQYLALGKSLVYSLLELLRPKDRGIPYFVDRFLSSFKARPSDTDDLLLKFKMSKD